MVEWANRLLAQGYVVEKLPSGAAKLDAQGSPLLVLDANGKPQLDPQHPGAAAELSAYVDQMQMFRQLTQAMSQPVGGMPTP